jgi:hypothetical protein
MFGVNQWAKSGLRSKCKNCVSEVGKKYTRSASYRVIDKKRRNTEARKAKMRIYVAKHRNSEKGEISRQNSYLKRFKLTRDLYNQLLKSQKGRCKICKSPPITKRLAVDHCHKTGKCRGLLCGKCNSGIAFFNENIDSLKNAITYLKTSRSK